MKIAILTFHNTANYGAALQAYATVVALRNIGVDAELLDYANAERRAIYAVRPRIWSQIRKGRISAAIKSTLGALMIRKRLANFASFYRQYTPRSLIGYETPSSLRQASLHYDYYMVGSDQVWNEKNNGGDLTYLLDFVTDPARTISYASSFGSASISDTSRPDYARLLKRIASLSVRERSGAALVMELTGRVPQVVVDPVYLLEAGEWNALTTESRPNQSPYILSYMADHKLMARFQRESGFEVKGRRIVHVGSGVGLSDLVSPKVKLRMSAGPLKFLSYLQHADLVLTTSFHATAFAVLHKRPFVSFLSGDCGRDSRIVDLLADLGLSHRIYHPDMTKEMIEMPLDFDIAHERLSLMRARSMDFLKAAVNSGPSSS